LFGKSDWDPLPPVAQNQVDGSNLFDNSIRDTSATGRNGDTARRQAIDRNPGDGDLSPNSHHSLASQPDSQRPGSRRTAGQRPENRPVKQVQTEQGPTQLNTILNKDQGGCAAGAGCASEAGPIDPAMSDHEMSRFLIRLLIDRRIGFDPRTVEGILREHKRSPEYVLKTICLCLVQQSHVPNKCGWIRKLLKEGNANFKPLAEAMGDIALEKLIATLNDWLSKSQGQPNLHLLNVPQSIDSAANKARQLRALKDAEASEQSRPRSPSVITHAPPGGPQFIGARRPLPEVFPE
jgi:hypothetical protein